MKKRIWLMGAVVMVLLLVMVVAIKQDTESSASHEINYAQIKVFDPIYVGLEKGFFDDEGVS